MHFLYPNKHLRLRDAETYTYLWEGHGHKNKVQHWDDIGRLLKSK